MDYGYIEDSAQVEISDEVINDKLNEIINKPDSPVATKIQLQELDNKIDSINVSMDFGVF